MRSPRGGGGGGTQRFRHFMFFGHVARMDSTRLAQCTLRWRGLQWWTWYPGLLAAKTGGQAGRRPAGRGVPRHSVRAIQEAFAEAQRAHLPVVQPRWRPPPEADRPHRDAGPVRRNPARENEVGRPHVDGARAQNPQQSAAETGAPLAEANDAEAGDEPPMHMQEFAQGREQYR